MSCSVLYVSARSSSFLFKFMLVFLHIHVGCLRTLGTLNIDPQIVGSPYYKVPLLSETRESPISTYTRIHLVTPFATFTKACGDFMFLGGSFLFPALEKPKRSHSDRV